MKSRGSFSRAQIAFLHDMVMAGLSFPLSLGLRLGDGLFISWSWPRLIAADGLFMLVAAVVFLSLRLYRGIWRYASVNDLVALTKAASLTVLAFLPLLFLATRLDVVPRSFPLINWFCLLALLGGPRFLYRIAKDRKLELVRERSGARQVPVLLVGAGDSADLFIRAAKGASAQYRPLGLLAGRQSRIGQGIHGVEVLGTLDDLEEVAAALKAKGNAPEKLIVTDDLSSAQLRSLFDRADALGMTLARLPKLTDLKDGVADKVEVKPVAVEDLLGRAQAVLDRSGLKGLIAGKRVLVTGAGGSIGSELVRQIGDCAPALLVLAEASEFALYSIDMEMSGRCPEVARLARIADVRDKTRIHQLMAEVTPDLVVHAAALKHVPLVEENPLEGLLTNAIGSRIVADACVAHQVPLMVMISTDKAVNPTNVMGSSKRMAECYIQALDAAQDCPTRFVTVRFGNVLGSTGSVVPLFQKQLAQGGPITVTHPEMTRYFMTIREAVELVLQATTLGIEGGQYRGRLFVLDMGEPVKIVHLARQMIRLAGLKPDIDVPIKFTGLRPGEKLFEEIFHGAEAPVPTERDGILLAHVRPGDLTWVAGQLDILETACRGKDLPAAMQVLQSLVPEYKSPDHSQP